MKSRVKDCREHLFRARALMIPAPTRVAPIILSTITVVASHKYCSGRGCNHIPADSESDMRAMSYKPPVNKLGPSILLFRVGVRPRAEW